MWTADGSGQDWLGWIFRPNCPGMDRRPRVPRSCYKILPSASWSSGNHRWGTVRYFSDLRALKYWSFQSGHTKVRCCTRVWEQHQAGFWRRGWMKCSGWGRGDNELLVDPLASDMDGGRRAPLDPAHPSTPAGVFTSSSRWMKTYIFYSDLIPYLYIFIYQRSLLMSTVSARTTQMLL